jgi:hypothetical protein
LGICELRAEIQVATGRQRANRRIIIIQFQWENEGNKKNAELFSVELRSSFIFLRIISGVGDNMIITGELLK